MLKRIVNKIKFSGITSYQPTEVLHGNKLSSLWGELNDVTAIRRSFDMTLNREGYFIDLHLTESDVIFISFEFGGYDKKGAANREAWGGGYFRYRDVSYIGIKPSWNNWYIAPTLDKVLDEIKPVLDKYSTIITYGSSMGGFAALTYADFLGASKVISFCPQSSRIPEICPWETPSNAELSRLDTESVYADAVGKYKNTKEVYVFADLYEDRDRRHVDRLKESNVTIINTPFIGHSIPAYLHALGVFTTLPIEIMNDDFNKIEFIKKLRNRRNLKRYFNIMKNKTLNNPIRSEIVSRYAKKSKMAGPD